MRQAERTTSRGRVTTQPRRETNSSAVTEHFSHAVHDLRRVIADGEHRVAAHRDAVRGRGGKRIRPRTLTQVGEKRDVAAEEGLKFHADPAEHRPRPDDDSPDDAEGLRHFVSIDAVRGRRDKIDAWQGWHGDSSVLWARTNQHGPRFGDKTLSRARTRS